MASGRSGEGRARTRRAPSWEGSPSRSDGRSQAGGAGRREGPPAQTGAAAALVLAAFAGCGEPRHPPAETAAGAWLEARDLEARDGRAAEAAPKATPAWDLAPALATLRVVAQVPRSVHGARDRPAEVLANDDGATAYARAGGGARAQEGSIVVERLQTDAGAPVHLVMRRRSAASDADDGGWVFGVADERGRVDGTAAAACARCHAEAPGDRLFGPPATQ